jgi:hypothetical protein
MPRGPPDHGRPTYDLRSMRAAREGGFEKSPEAIGGGKFWRPWRVNDFQSDGAVRAVNQARVKQRIGDSLAGEDELVHEPSNELGC